MAKYNTKITGDLEHLLEYLEQEIVSRSVSASYEAAHDYTVGDVKVAIRVFERYSYVGSNRVSLNLTLIEYDGQIDVCAITSGGSQAVVFKINTFGENGFLDKFKKILDSYKG